MDMELSAMARDDGHAPVLQRSIVTRPATDRRPRGRAAAVRRRGGAAAALLAKTLAALALWAAPASASTLVVEGAGEGHGVGMSQDGALGYAEHGWSDAAILAHYYTGTTLGEAPAGYQVKVLVGAKVVKVPLERYVRGVVSAEMPSSWPAPALEAQAIASRTYALTAHAGGSRFDVYSDTRSQMYRGVAAETAATNAAVTATAGQIVTYAGRPATTYYFASSGGMTEDIQNSFLGSTPEPWLLGVADAYETKASDWKLSITFAAAGARLRGLVKGSFRGIEVLTRGVSPRIVSAEVLGSRGVSSGERARTGGSPRAEQHVGVLQREERHARDTRARPQRTRAVHASRSRKPAGASAGTDTGATGRLAGAGERRVEQRVVVRHRRRQGRVAA